MKRNLIFTLLLCYGTQLVAQQKQLTLENIWGGYFDEQKLTVHLLNNGQGVAFMRSDPATGKQEIRTLDFATGKLPDSIFSNQVMKDTSAITFTFFQDFALSPDDSRILIKTEIEPLYRSSTKEFNFVWDRNKGQLKPVSADGKQSYVNFSPDSKKIAFVRDGNLYVKDLESDAVTAVSFDGAMGQLLYGSADALYENGFGMQQAYAWSPDGEKIAYLRFNEGTVLNYPITMYERSYPNVVNQRYPKAGEMVPEVQVYVYDIRNKLTTKMDVGINPNQYITGLKWLPDGSALLIQRLNRPQNQLELLRNDLKTGNHEVIYVEQNLGNYVQVRPDNIVFLPNRNSFLWLSEKDGYNHIYEISMTTRVATQITKGEWEVFSIEGVNEGTGEIFFTSNEPSPRQRHLYKVSLDGRNRRKLTEGDGCHRILLASNNRFFLDESSVIDFPATYSIYNTAGKEIQKIWENKELRKRMKEYSIPDADLFSFKSNDSTQLQGWMIRPGGTSDTRRNPLLVYVYGGTGKQEALDQWGDKFMMTMRYFTNLGFYVVCIDPRGTSGRGETFRKANYKKVGEIEMDDIKALKNYMTRNYRVDTARTAIMGWSYGGYLASLAATKYAGLFNKYVAIAPVSNWRYYENVYAERLLSSPSENAEGYRNSSATNYVNDYKGGLLLVHGTADDNVHLQNSMVLSEELIRANKQFDQYFSPNRNHSLSSDRFPNVQRINLFTKIANFLLQGWSK
jgi:dipeptidyl-peptidase 4